MTDDPLDERGPEPTRNYPLEAGILVLRLTQAALLVLAVLVMLGILLTAADANPDKDWVQTCLDLAEDCAGPFTDTFTQSDPEDRLAANYGLAFGVYLALAFLVGFGIDALVKLRPRKPRPGSGR